MKHKKKKAILILSGAFLILSSVLFFGKDTHTFAEDKELKSAGNLLFEQDGTQKAAIYASDIKYLQGELNTLFNEIP